MSNTIVSLPVNSLSSARSEAAESVSDTVLTPALQRFKTLTAVDKCRTYAVFNECESDKHRFAYLLECTKPYCPVCGQDGSNAHKRRIPIDKIRQIARLGKFVIEYPIVNRQQLASKDALRKATTDINKVFGGKRAGRKGKVNTIFGRGGGRWHYYGDYIGLIDGHRFNVDKISGQYAEDFT